MGFAAVRALPMLVEHKNDADIPSSEPRAPTRSRYFTRPPLSLIEPQANDSIIDYAHLRRYTFGDVALEREVLGLFIMQLPVTIAALQHGESETDRRRAAHTLKGSARAVGAWRIAALAEAAEHVLSKGSAAALKQAVADILVAARDVEAAISEAPAV